MNRKDAKPLLIPNVDGVLRHPLAKIAEKHTTAEIAKWLGHKTHATVSIYVSRAKKARSTIVPAEWVLPLARRTGIPPHTWRPDLYLPKWTVDTVN